MIDSNWYGNTNAKEMNQLTEELSQVDTKMEEVLDVMNKLTTN